MSGASEEMAVPASSVAIDTSSFMSVFEEAEECACPRLTSVPEQIDGVPGAFYSGPWGETGFEPGGRNVLAASSSTNHTPGKPSEYGW